MSIKLLEFNRYGYNSQEFHGFWADTPWLIVFKKWRDPFPEIEGKYWLGHAYGDEYPVPKSWFIDTSRQELWKLLNDPETGIPKYNDNMKSKYLVRKSLIGRGVDYRVCALIQAARQVRRGEDILLVYEPGDHLQAEMIARCIQWVAGTIA
ncbi:MAG: hypothetical protein EYR95_17765 [Phormidium sp. SL48-SHIP]|nr:MAG: hypothetical protein EYR95_17765 [Phormidium sp. SL48-SHIP]